jgi:hypothetical protein
MSGENDNQPTAEDRAELELRDRLTVLEAWREHVDVAIPMLMLGGAALALATLAVLVLLRRRESHA